MIKKKYIKPSIYSKKARVMRMIMTSPTGNGFDQGAGDGETFDARCRNSEWDDIFSQGQSDNIFDY